MTFHDLCHLFLIFSIKIRPHNIARCTVHSTNSFRWSPYSATLSTQPSHITKIRSAFRSRTWTCWFNDAALIVRVSKRTMDGAVLYAWMSTPPRIWFACLCCRQTIGTKCLRSWLHDTAAVANGRCAHCRAQLLHSTPISRQRHRAWTSQQRQHLQDLESEMLGYEVVQTEDGERRIYNSIFQPRGITSRRSGSRHHALLERDPLRENAIPWPPAFGLGTQQVATSHTTGSQHRRLNRHLLREPHGPIWHDSDALRFSFQEGELSTSSWNANPIRRDLHPPDP